MSYLIAADLVLVAHLLFICFVVGGSFLAWRWPRLIWVQLPAMAYGALVELAGDARRDSIRSPAAYRAGTLAGAVGSHLERLWQGVA